MCRGNAEEIVASLQELDAMEQGTQEMRERITSADEALRQAGSHFLDGLEQLQDLRKVQSSVAASCQVSITDPSSVWGHGDRVLHIAQSDDAASPHRAGCRSGKAAAAVVCSGWPRSERQRAVQGLQAAGKGAGRVPGALVRSNAVRPSLGPLQHEKRLQLRQALQPCAQLLVFWMQGSLRTGAGLGACVVWNAARVVAQGAAHL